MLPDITILIPNYNGAHLMRANLPTVRALAQAYGGKAGIVVVDDGSADDSVQVLTGEFPDVTTVVHERNQGFAEAVHTGVRAAPTELIFLLNSDVQPGMDCLERLVGYFSDPQTFSVSPLIVNEHGEVKRHSWNLRNFRRGELRLASWSLDQARRLRQVGPLPNLYASGGSMLFRKSMFEALGGFDDIFKPFYGEDYDLGVRAWRRGWPSYFDPDCQVVHQRMGSIKENVKMKRVMRVRRRNKFLVEWIHLPASHILLKGVPYSLMRLLGELLILDWPNVMGFVDAVRRVPVALAARRRLKAHEVMGIEAVVARLQAALKSA